MSKENVTPEVVFFRGVQTRAAYLEQEVPFYRGNPFIEALPPVLSEEQVDDALGYYPKYHPSYRKLSTEARLQMIQDSTQFFQVLPVHFDLQQRMSRMIRSGYRNRNPMERGHWQRLGKQIKTLPPSTAILKNSARPQPSGFSIIGLPGVGKTSSIEGLLSLYPQVIFHSKYGSREFTCCQIAWLKLETPFDGSIKAICLQFFEAIDDILSTNYYLNAKSKNTDELLLQMARIAANHGLGALVIDEIQRLSHLKSGGAGRMLNFFVQLSNTIGVPVVLVGTPRARAVLSGQFHQIRRGMGQGNLIWDRMPEGTWIDKGDESAIPGVWQLFVEALWLYQYTRTKTPLTAELAGTLYEQTQGIVDIAAKLYMLVQSRAIATSTDGSYIITTDLIRSVATDYLSEAQPILTALRMGDTRVLSLYDDLKPLDLKELMQQELERQLELPLAEQNDRPISHGSASPGAGTSAEGAAAKTEGNRKSEDKTPKGTRRGRRQPQYDQDDLRQTLNAVTENQLSPAEQLRHSGHVESSAQAERRTAP
jgi:hypothetical protein